MKNKKLNFPKELNRDDHFKCPIWVADETQYVDSLNKASDPYIEESKKNLKPFIDKRNKE